MKRLFYAGALAFGGLLLSTFSSFALAQAGYVTLGSFSGNPGTSLTVSGGGWQNGDTISIYFGSVSGAPSATTTVASGQFSTQARVPVTEPQGPLTVYAVDNQLDQATNAYYVVPFAPQISINAPSNTPLSVISVSGSGFAPNEAVSLDVGGNPGTTTRADASGSFSNSSLTIPNIPSGLYLVNATGALSHAHTAFYLWVNPFYPNVAPSSWYITPGGTLSFSGSGFAPHELIDVKSGATIIATTTTDGNGAFNGGAFHVPLSLRNSVATFTLTGSLSNASASVNVTVGDLYPYAYPSAWYLLPGALLTFSGGGFGPNETVNVYQNTTPVPVATFTTGQGGGFARAGTTTVPFNHGPSLTYTLVGQQSDVSTQTALSVGAFFPTIAPSAYYSAPGGIISLSGAGFAPHESVTVQSGTFATTTVADSSGSISVSGIQLPFIGGITLLITARGAESNASASVGVTLGAYYPILTPSTYYAFPGDTLTFSGSGFAGDETLAISGAATGTVMTNSRGSFTGATTTLPYSAKSSASFIFIGSKSSTPVSTTITVGTLAPYLSLSSYYASPGGSVSAAGIGFGAHESVTIAAGSFSTTTVANVSGNTPMISIPVAYSSSGSLSITMMGAQTGAHASALVGVAQLTPGVTADLYYIAPGGTVTFSGSGFAPNEIITASWGGMTATATTSGTGTFTLPLKMPKQNGGTVAINFKSSITNTNSNITITMAQLFPGIWFSNYWAQGGSPLTIFGTGFLPSEEVSFSAQGARFATGTADLLGALSVATTIPFAPPGPLSITAAGAMSGASTTAGLTVAPVYTNLQLGSYAGAPGTAIEFKGSGYLPHEPVAVTTDRTGSSTVASFSADGTGSFDNSSFIIPGNFTGGNLTLTLTGLHSFSSKSIVFYVTAP